MTLLPRRIVIPHEAMLKATAPISPSECVARYVELPVMVDWPELRLTQKQIIANVLAKYWGHEEPFPDQQIFSVMIPRTPFSIRD